jgi:hypothetical protein
MEKRLSRRLLKLPLLDQERHHLLELSPVPFNKIIYIFTRRVNT